MRKRRWKRKLCFSILGVAAVTPFLAFGISNLFLISPKGRALVAAAIERRFPLDASVQGASWSPWNGITIYGIRVEQPGDLRQAMAKPLLTVQSARIHPDWLALCGKRLEIKGLEIAKPELVLPIELMAQIPHKETDPAVAAKPPDLASATPQSSLVAPPQDPVVIPAPSPPAGVAGAPVEPPPKPPAKPATRKFNIPIWVDIRQGRLEIVSLKAHSPILGATGINGSVPIDGKPVESAITIDRLTGFGQTAPTKVVVPLNWDAPVLGLKVGSGEISGIEFTAGAQIGLVAGVPFKVDAIVPEQKDREIRIVESARAKIGALKVQGRIQGYLQVPASWQGQSIAQVLAVETEIGGHKAYFDHGRALFAFQGGTLRCLDARLSGEQATIIANAAILGDGRMAGIARIVAAPESLISVSSFIRPGLDEPHLTPLSTPQRAALDLQVFGRPGDLFFRPDPAAAPLRLR